MNNQTRQILLIALILVTIWDTFTTVTGTMAIIGNGKIQLFLSIIFGLIISGFLLSTMLILKNPKDDIIIMGAKALWFLALGYDLYTSFTGNQSLIAESSSSDEIGQLAITIGMTLFVSSSPIAISYITYDR